MAGQIIKRGDKRWLVRIFQGRDENGKRRYVNKTIRGTKKNAESYLTAKLRDKDLGINIEPAGESLNKYLDKWLNTAAKPRLRTKSESRSRTVRAFNNRPHARHVFAYLA